MYVMISDTGPAYTQSSALSDKDCVVHKASYGGRGACTVNSHLSVRQTLYIALSNKANTMYTIVAVQHTVQKTGYSYREGVHVTMLRAACVRA
jgi:hypothetical protein